MRGRNCHLHSGLGLGIEGASETLSPDKENSMPVVLQGPWPPLQMCWASGHSSLFLDIPWLSQARGSRRSGSLTAWAGEAGLGFLRGICTGSAYVLSLAGAAEQAIVAEPWGPHGCREARKELGRSRRGEASFSMERDASLHTRQGLGATHLLSFHFQGEAQERGRWGIGTSEAEPLKVWAGTTDWSGGAVLRFLWGNGQQVPQFLYTRKGCLVVMQK